MSKVHLVTGVDNSQMPRLVGVCDIDRCVYLGCFIHNRGCTKAEENSLMDLILLSELFISRVPCLADSHGGSLPQAEEQFRSSHS